MTTEPDPSESCVYCGATSRVQQSTSSSPKVRGWSCADCGTEWWVSVVNPHLRSTSCELAAAVQEISRLRRTPRQVVTLAWDAPTLTNQELRARLLALAEECGAR